MIDITEFTNTPEKADMFHEAMKQDAAKMGITEEQSTLLMSEPYPITMDYHRHFEDLEVLHLMTSERQTPKKFRNCVNVSVGSEKKQGRNELCACGSGNKFKKCCGK